MPACALIIVKFVFESFQGILSMPKSFVDYLSTHYKFHSEDPLEFYAVPPGSLIVDVSIMMIGLLSNMKRKLMVLLSFVLFVPNVSARAD